MPQLLSIMLTERFLSCVRGSMHRSVLRVWHPRSLRTVFSRSSHPGCVSISAVERSVFREPFSGTTSLRPFGLRS